MRDPGATASTSRENVAWRFEAFRLCPADRLLERDGRPVAIGSRALDLLVVLVERAGGLVDKADLIRSVWPDTTVVEANLSVHMAALRRALGDGVGDGRYIQTVPGRGYRFIARAERSQSARPIDRLTSNAIRSDEGNLPAALTRLVGREETLEALGLEVMRHRLSTLVGPAGVGKTSTALEFASRAAPAFPDGAWWIDLAAVASSDLVPAAFAAALGLGADLSTENLGASLGRRDALFVIDNCEHLIDATAAITGAILRHGPKARILATSREPLGLAGEHVRRLDGLPSPSVDDDLSAAKALAFPAVRLFVERAQAVQSDFRLKDGDVAALGSLCRSLDGLPLAIEFAAARIDVFGVVGLEDQLGAGGGRWSGMRRGGAARHRTVTSALDWSYDLLSASEQALFRTLSVFSGGFALDAVLAVAPPDATRQQVADDLASLLLKSLVSSDLDTPGTRFRLLAMMRSYAWSKLDEAGEAGSARRRHAAHFHQKIDAFSAAQAFNRLGFGASTPAGNTGPRPDGIDAATHPFARDIDNLRQALATAVEEDDDGASAYSFATATVPILLELSLMQDVLAWTEQALATIPEGRHGGHEELVLRCAFGLSSVYAHGVSVRARSALLRAVAIAETLGESFWRIQALAALSTIGHRSEHFAEALEFASAAAEVARTTDDVAAIEAADCALATSFFFLGRYDEARSRTGPIIERPRAVLWGDDNTSWGVDHLIYARAVHAHALWAQGFLDQAALQTEAALRQAEQDDRTVSRCFILSWCGCLFALRAGDMALASARVDDLLRLSRSSGQDGYAAAGRGYEGLLFAWRGDLDEAELAHRECLSGLRAARNDLLVTPFLSSLAELLIRKGRHEEALLIVEDACSRSVRTQGLWWRPEALRVRAEARRAAAPSDLATVEADIRESLGVSRRLGSVFWEVRAATVLSDILVEQGRGAEAVGALADVLQRLPEGHSARDVVEARSRLDRLVAGVDRGASEASPAGC